jgi:hypothetical protein
MNKILTMVTIILSMILTTNLSFGQSNFKKGNKFVEGSVNYSKVNNTTQSSLNLSGAHFFTNRFALGLTGAMSESKTSGGIFGRCYFYEKNAFSVFSQLTAQTSVETDTVHPQSVVSTKCNNLNLGFGLNYFVTNRLALTTSICSLVDVTSHPNKVGYTQPDINVGLSGIDNPLSAAKFGILFKF